MDEAGDDFSPNQFEKPVPQVPLKVISLVVALLLAGSLCLVLFIMNFFKIYSIYDKQHEPVLFSLALITLVPGVYHVHLAWMAWRKFPGYSYDQLAQFD